MNKQQFMDALRSELSQLPPEEIDAAAEYFEECFAEATDGLDDEKREAEEARLAEEFGNPKRVAAQIRADYAARILDGGEPAAQTRAKTGKLSAIWWVIIGICAAPVAVPLAIVIFAIFIVIGVCIFAGVIAGGIAAFAGLVNIATMGAAGVMVSGLGFMMLAAALAAGYGAVVAIIALSNRLSERNKAKAGIVKKEADTNEEAQ